MQDSNVKGSPITIDDILNSQWKEIIGRADNRECSEYQRLFLAASSESEKNGDQRKESVYRLLGDMTSFHMKSDTSKEPFGPMVIMNGKRSAIPSDLTEEQLGIFLGFLPEIEDAELRARIADVLWMRKRDYKVAELAISSYIESAKVLEDPDFWPRTFQRIERAFRLAVMLGKGNGSLEKVIGHIESVLGRYNGEDPMYLSEKLMGLLQEQDLGDPLKYSKLAEKAANRAETTHDWHRAQSYWQRKAVWDRLAKDDAGRKESLTRAAETYVKMAEASTRGDRASYMVAGSHLITGIESYRRIGGMSHRVDELHQLLLEYEKKSLKEFGVISSPPIDLAEAIKGAKESVKGKNVIDALCQLCTTFRIESVDVLRKRVEESAKDFPLSHLMTTMIVNDKGKVVGKRQGLLLDENDQYEIALRSHMYHEAQIAYSIDVQALIHPMRRQIVLDNDIRVDDLGSIVTNNPLIPEGREYIYAAGLLAGLQGDLLTSIHLLIPQFENSVRYILEQQGIVTSKIDDEGIQKEHDLNTLLYHDKVKEIFKDDLVFHLQALLVAPEGANIRNRMAHGLMTTTEFFSPNAVYIWGLILRLCCWPIIVRIHQDAGATGHETAPSDPPII